MALTAIGVFDPCRWSSVPVRPGGYGSPRIAITRRLSNSPELFRPAPHLHILHQNDAPEITGLDSRSQDILLEHKGVEINLKGTGAPGSCRQRS